METKTVLVTGSSGHIAFSLLKQLREDGQTVKGVDIKTGTDLRNPANCIEVTKGIDTVYHLAANKGGVAYLREKESEIMGDNMKLTLNMLEACVKNNVKKFVFPSSGCVYPIGLQESFDVSLKETDVFPAQPDGLYGWEKLMAEQLCQSYMKDYGIETYIARLQNPYGAGAIPTGTNKDQVIEALMYKAINSTDGGTIEIWGDGRQKRGFFHALDCAKGLIALAKTDYHNPVNLGPEKATEIGRVADIIISISGKRLTKKYIASQKMGVNARLADITLAKQLIAWKPEITIEEGIKDEYNWITQRK